MAKKKKSKKAKKKSKKKSKKSSKKKEKDGNERREWQMRIIVILMVSILIISLIAGNFIGGSEKFRYMGSEFTKTDKDGLTIYYADLNFPSRNFGYYFREDPRNLERIEIEDDIELKKNVALVSNSDLICDENSLALTSLGVNFFSRLKISTFVGMNNKTKALENNLTYVGCDDERYSVMIFRESNESSIERENNCYYLNVANCEMMNITERFVIGWYGTQTGR